MRLLAACALLGGISAPVVTDTAASAAPEPPGARMLDWAEAHDTGRPYQYGGTGPYGYDCSGTVYAAARAVGIDLPRTSQAMAAGSAHLAVIPLRAARRGDILVWPGGGHVMFATDRRNLAYGALYSGTVVGLHPYGGGFYPAYALRVTG